ncbi:hypothetical protein L7F22_066139 [Adiantum nelumboides]|nr:hypothetical protein [Adiantum nelumboides]
MWTEDFLISPLKHEDVNLGAPWFDCPGESIKFPKRKISFKFRKKDMYINPQDSSSTIPLVNDQAFDKSIKSSIFTYMLFVKGSLNGVNETQVNESGMHEDLELSNFLNQFQDVFIDYIPGWLSPKQGDDNHMIELLPRSSPPNKPPYRVSQAQQEEIMRQVNKLVEKGMVRPSSSPFCSPVRLVQKKDDTYREVFKFIDQDHYERLADAVADYVQEIMVKEYDMIKLELPFEEHLGDDEEDADLENGAPAGGCPIFLASNCKEADVVLLLLCGTGRVASGQWARKLCINDSLKMGSVLPFLDWAREHSFGVIVLNPNRNDVETMEDSRVPIPFNDCAEAHVNYVWRAVCEDLPAKHFVLVAHSYGGISTCNLLRLQGEEVLQRLRCVAFTDSAQASEVMSEEAKEFLARHCINWASSSEPLDTVLALPQGSNAEELDSEAKRSKGNFFERLRARSRTCKVLSAGTEVHEETTMSAFPSICRFLIEHLQLAGATVGLKME